MMTSTALHRQHQHTHTPTHLVKQELQHLSTCPALVVPRAAPAGLATTTARGLVGNVLQHVALLLRLLPQGVVPHVAALGTAAAAAAIAANVLLLPGLLPAAPLLLWLAVSVRLLARVVTAAVRVALLLLLLLRGLATT
jgi:hypothetical protein